MKKHKLTSNFLLAILMAASCIGFTSNALADSVENEIKQEVKDLKSTIKRLKRLAAKSAGRRALGALKAPGLTDSDSDGLPDAYENAIGSNSCDSDSDDDGISDDDESKSGSRPDDSTSGEIEAKGTITAITSTTVTLDGNTYVATGTTQYLKGATSLASFSVGDLVEVKGVVKNGVIELVKIKADD